MSEEKVFVEIDFEDDGGDRISVKTLRQKVTQPGNTFNINLRNAIAFGLQGNQNNNRYFSNTGMTNSNFSTINNWFVMNDSEFQHPNTSRGWSTLAASTALSQFSVTNSNVTQSLNPNYSNMQSIEAYSFHDPNNNRVCVVASYRYSGLTDLRFRTILFTSGNFSYGSSASYAGFIALEETDFTVKTQDEWELSTVIRIDEFCYNMRMWMTIIFGANDHLFGKNKVIVPGWKDLNGNTIPDAMLTRHSRTSGDRVSDQMTFRIGASNTPVDIENDYNVVSEIQNITYGTSNIRLRDFISSESIFEVVFTGYAVSNNSGPVTVNEIALLRSFPTGASAFTHCMTHRQVTDEPFIMQPGVNNEFTVIFRIKIIHNQSYYVAVIVDGDKLDSHTPQGLFFEGQTVTISTTPKTGVTITDFEVNTNDGEPVEFVRTQNHIRFTMPAQHTKVSVLTT